jgi:hypothetical protein
MAELGYPPGPVAGTGAGLPADQAGWHLCNKLHELVAWYFWAHKGRFACFIYAMRGEDVLGEINSNGYDSLHFLYQVS